MIRCVRVLIVLLVLSAWSATAGGTELQAAWLRSDLGLDGAGDGFAVGIGGTWPLGAGPFDVAASGEYLRKRGSQPQMVGNPDVGLIRADAEVTLDVLQPAAFVGWNPIVGAVRPRLYAGFSVAIKLDETWDRPEGATNRDYGYEDVDAALHVGAQLHVAARVFLDARYSHGLLEQVVDRDGDAAAAKALDPLTGAKLPEDGDTTTSYQIGLGVTF